MADLETSAQATLVAHADCNKVSREELFAIPSPIGTETFKPVAHKELIMTLEVCLQHRGITITNEQYAVRADGSRLFAAFNLSMDNGDSCAALGLRTGNDRTMKLSIVAGLRVFVCDNLALSGDSIILNRKHSSGLDLMPELYGAVQRYEERYTLLQGQVSELKALTLADTEAKAMMHDAFVQEMLPVRYLPNVSQAYFNPQVVDWEPRTGWSLLNAFTGVMKEMSLNRRMEATQKLGRAFGLVKS